MARLTKADFRAWLLRQEPDDIVGIPQDGAYCPIATYLSREFNVRGQVEEIFRIEYDSQREYPLPAWASRFILKVDRAGKEVTTKHALQILSEVV